MESNPTHQYHQSKDATNVVRTHLKRKDACYFLSCSANTLDKYCIAYNIYPTKIGGVNYYAASDLNKLFHMN